MKPDNKAIREWAERVVRDLAYVSPEAMGQHVFGMLGRAWMMGVEQEREDCAVVAERWGNDDAADAIRARSKASS